MIQVHVHVLGWGFKSPHLHTSSLVRQGIFYCPNFFFSEKVNSAHRKRAPVSAEPVLFLFEIPLLEEHADRVVGVQEVSWTVRDAETADRLEKAGCLIIFENF